MASACADNWKQEREVNGVPVMVWFHLVSYESGFKANLIGYNKDGTRDYGIMQLNGKYLPYFSDMFNKEKPFNPFVQKDNIRIGCAYLLHLYRQTGSWFGAVWAYNAGPGSWHKGIMPKQTERMLAYIFEQMIGEENGKSIPEQQR